MTMGRCRECKKPVSSEAATCPACGASKPYVPKRMGVLGWIGVTFVGLFAFVMCTPMADRPSGGTSQAAATPRAPTLIEQEAQNRAAMQNLKPAELKPILRDRLLPLCERFNPSLNYIKAEVRGSALYCVHSFYSQHSLDIGGLGPAIGGWTREWSSELKRAGIKRVGVYGTGEYASGSWFEVP